MLLAQTFHIHAAQQGTASQGAPSGQADNNRPKEGSTRWGRVLLVCRRYIYPVSPHPDGRASLGPVWPILVVFLSQTRRSLTHSHTGLRVILPLDLGLHTIYAHNLDILGCLIDSARPSLNPLVDSGHRHSTIP